MSKKKGVILSFCVHRNRRTPRSGNRHALLNACHRNQKGGCYVDMMNPLPNGAPICLSIAAAGAFSKAKAKSCMPRNLRAPVLDRRLVEAAGNH